MAARLNSSLISRIGVGTNMSSGTVRRTDTALYKNVLYLFIDRNIIVLLLKKHLNI